MKKQLFLLILTLMPMVMSAVEVEIDGIYYNLIDKNKSAEVIGNPSIYRGVINIPETVFFQGNYYTVTSIGELAFYGSLLTSLNMPNSVSTIKNSAFKYSKITNITIPNSVTSIGREAFWGCSNLNTIFIPISLAKVGISAFTRTDALTSVYITDISAWCNIDFEGPGANPLHSANHLYLNGEEIKDLIIPKGIKTIKKYCFDCCLSLNSVLIPDGITSIEDYVFSGCENMTSINIPNSVTTIGISSFGSCSKLPAVIIPPSVISIGNQAFQNCEQLSSIKFEEGLVNIGQNAFENCKSLISLSIPNSVTDISFYAFSGCSGLTSVHIKSLEAWCKISFKSRFSNPLEYAHHLYLNGKEIKDLVIPINVARIRDFAFNGCSGLTSVTTGNSVTSIGDCAFFGCSGLTSVTIGNSVTSIGASSFKDCASLTLVTIPNSVTSIGTGAFSSCQSISSILIENGVSSIGENAFEYCTSLTTITLPNSIFEIRNSTFLGCSKLTSVIFQNVNFILSGAFANCQELTDFYCYNTKVPFTDTNAFNNSYIDYATLHVPAESINAYKTAKPWKNFKEIVALTDDDPKPTGIMTIVATPNENNNIYDLNGVRLSDPQKGVNIVNGKKYVIK